MATHVVLVRHGETEWTISRQHTGHTDIPLTEEGRRQAQRLRRLLLAWEFAKVLSSPSSRALETARLAGFAEEVETTADLMEWDYGDYEGLTTDDIREDHRRWSLWLDGTPSGETGAQVGARVDRVLAEIDDVEGDVALFAHGHVLRVLTARWLGLAPAEGRLFALDPASLSVLGYEHETKVIQRWNDPG